MRRTKVGNYVSGEPLKISGVGECGEQGNQEKSKAPHACLRQSGKSGVMGHPNLLGARCLIHAQRLATQDVVADSVVGLSVRACHPPAQDASMVCIRVWFLISFSRC